ncbi:MAG: nucleotidyltransferase family protein, partial [Ruminococcus sp.]|nr:nucleotidyltransferase family protein [Ruminococcus sp.]
MKISGIVCEYNPFHNGHMYHIEKTRENGATHIVAVMSGNFVQRGEPAVLDKFTRAELAVKSGVDLVIELPVAYCLSPAEKFASGAVNILDSLGVVDEISFGSECGNIENLIRTAYISEDSAHSEDVRLLMEKGCTYPKALHDIIRRKDIESAEIIASPNNLLAVEYLKALKSSGSSIKPFTVGRVGTYHDSNMISGRFASASHIRRLFYSGEDFGGLMPEIWENALKNGNTAELRQLEQIILYCVRTSSLEKIAGTGGVKGIAERIYKNRAESLDNLLESVKSKCFTMAGIKRVLMSLLIGITREDTEIPPPYIRVLALNSRGQEILASARKTKKIPVGTSLSKLSRLNSGANRFAEIENTASDV